MKKIILSLIFAVNIVTTCFAQKTEIIDPPRPHRKFKWLLVIEHNLYPGHIHYLYTDKYNIFQEPDGWKWILPEGYYESFSAYKGESPTVSQSMPGIFYTDLLSYPEISKYTIFLKSKAPKPSIPSNNFKFNDPNFKKFWLKHKARIVELRARKAKIMFTVNSVK